MSIALPPVSEAVPRTLVWVFFFFLVRISKVTEPVGTPPAGDIGLIWAIRFSETTFFFLEPVSGRKRSSCWPG